MENISEKDQRLASIFELLEIITFSRQSVINVLSTLSEKDLCFIEDFLDKVGKDYDRCRMEEQNKLIHAGVKLVWGKKDDKNI